MLSVKLNVLKSYAKQFAYFVMASWVFYTPDAFSFSDQGSKLQAGPSSADLVSMILALLFVVAIIVIIALVARKFNLMPGQGQQIKVVSNLSLGGRERVVVIDIDGKQHALGVSNSSVNYLFPLENPINSTVKSASQPLTDSKMVSKLNKLFGYTAPQQQNNNKETRRD